MISKIFKPPKDYRGDKNQKTIARLEQWARDHNVILQKIPEEPGKKTADYEAIFPDSDTTSVIIEVKEILTPFQVDPKTGVMKVLEKELSGNISPEGRFRPADPIRKKIRVADAQLKAYANAGYPTLLLIGMWNRVLDRILELDIPIAMSGGGPIFELVGTGLQLVGTAKGGRQAADDINQSISGIGRLESGETVESPEHIIIYRHNNPQVAFDKELPGIRYALQYR